jgi:two-component system, response regulator PdtaR
MDEPKKILIVEDETLTAMALEAYLQDKGLRSLGFVATGEEAVEMARAERPDLILMDYSLAGKMSGIEAARAIEAEVRTAIVVISGYSEEVILERSAGYRPKAILAKPLDEGDIDRILQVL